MTKLLVLVLVAGLILRLVISTAIYSGDLNNHTGWGKSILEHGFSGAYDRDYVGIMQPTYPPVALYAFTTSIGLYQLINTGIVNLNKSVDAFPSGLVWAFEDQDVEPAFTKVITIMADIGLGVLIYIFTRSLVPQKPKLALLASAAYVFNPAVWYVSSLWGQIESVPLFFIALSIYLSRKSPLASGLVFTAALLSKQTSIIFAPFVGYLLYRRWGWFSLFKSALFSLLLWWLLYLPFSNSSNLLFPLTVYINRLQTGSGSVWISDHAFNLWAILTKLQKIPDTTALIGSIPSVWIGYALFALLFLVIWVTFTRTSKSSLFLSLSVLSLSAFMVLTKMHERYSAPVIPFLVLAAVKRPFLWPVYILVSFSHLANLYQDWYYPRIHPLDTWLTDWTTILIIIGIFTFCLAALLITQISEAVFPKSRSS